MQPYRPPVLHGFVYFLPTTDKLHHLSFLVYEGYPSRPATGDTSARIHNPLLGASMFARLQRGGPHGLDSAVTRHGNGSRKEVRWSERRDLTRHTYISTSRAETRGPCGLGSDLTAVIHSHSVHDWLPMQKKAPLCSTSLVEGHPGPGFPVRHLVGSRSGIS